MNRNLAKTLFQFAGSSGRSGKKNPVPYKRDIRAIQAALVSCVKKGSICPICGKVIDLSLGVSANGDENYVNQNGKAPSCDRITNHGNGYVFLGSKNNVRIVHRECNKARKDAPIDFKFLSTLKYSEKEVKEILTLNSDIIKNNFIVTKTLTNSTMKNTKKNQTELSYALLRKIELLRGGIEAIAYLDFVHSSSMNHSSRSTPIISEENAQQVKETLKKAGCPIGVPFQIKEFSEKAAKIYKGKGTSASYMASMIGEAGGHNRGGISRSGNRTYVISK